MTLRPATDADIPQMHRIRMSVRENQLSDSTRVQPHHYEEMLRSGRGWVYEVDGQIVGFAIADFHTASVWALFVHPAYERRGIGRQLHDAMVQSMFASGAARVWLTTEPGTRAERFYQSAGWEREDIEANGEVRYRLTQRAFGEVPQLARQESNAKSARS